MSARPRPPHLLAEPANGQPPIGALVLLHAFPLGARMWASQHSLAGRGWRLVMPQRRGFDSTPLSDERRASIEDDAADVVDLLDQLAIERAVVCGLSMGGYVALSLYRLAPQRVRALVLADTRADADSVEAATNRERLIALARSGGAAAIADEMVPKLLGVSTLTTAPDVEARVRALIESQTSEAIVSALRAMMSRVDSTPLLSSIAVPTLVLAGDEDTLTPVSLARSMASHIPGSEMVVLPQAGHLSSLEQPVRFNAALLTFLNRL